MRILILGYGKEGKSLESYFRTHYNDTDIVIWQDFTTEELLQRDYSSYDIIFRSPSVPPLGLEKESSITKYFFDHCPCPIIGVTATKGKGTTCSFIKSLLDAHGEDTYLVGNIGVPALDVLDNLKTSSIAIYEMSSFQLWDLKKSPHISVIGTIEPDHLNVHEGYADYLNAKSNICRYQSAEDYCVYYSKNGDSIKVASATEAPQKIPYPFILTPEVEQAITIPGQHNIENAMAAIAAVASFYNISPDEYLQRYESVITKGLNNFHGLPHRLEFVRKFRGISYYDDNFSTNTASTKVALDAFPGQKLIPIIGGRDKTDYQDLPELYEILNRPQIPKVILIGESGREFCSRYNNERFILADSLEDAIKKAGAAAEATRTHLIVMSPAAASFDMFESVYDRGDKFKNLILSLG